MNKLSINGAELAYRDTGSGTPIIFLHAFPLNQTMWDDQIHALASHYRVITFDWRGFGESSLGDGIKSIDTFAEDLAGLMKNLGIGQAAICGLSMGGYAAFAFYRIYPDLVSTLILADTRAIPDTEEGRQARYEMVSLVRDQGVARLSETMIPRLLGETTMRNTPGTADRLKEIIESGNPEGIAQALMAMAKRADSTGLLGEISCPTLIISGNEDKLIPMSEAEKMSLAIHGSSIEIIHDSGHLPNIEQPEAFNRVLFKFLDNHSPEGKGV